MVAANPIFDDEQLAYMAYEMTFDLLDSSYNVIGNPGPIEASSVQLDVGQKTLRSLSDVAITQNAMADINPFTDRLSPVMVMADGTRWPLGVFVFSNQEDTAAYGVATSALTLLDQSALIDQLCLADVSYGPGTPIVQVIVATLNLVGIPIEQIVYDPADTAVVSAAVTWPAGTSYLTIVEELAALGGFFTPYFDNRGTCIIRRPPPIINSDGELFYRSSGTAKVANHFKSNSGILQAPNTYLVIDTAPKAAAIAAVAYVEPQLPWSVQNRNGYRVTEVIRTQGLGSQEQAQAMANAAALASGGFRQIAFESRPDPRHDAYMLIGWDGVVYRELSWSMPCNGVGTQSHVIAQGGFPAISGLSNS